MPKYCCIIGVVLEATAELVLSVSADMSGVFRRIYNEWFRVTKPQDSSYRSEFMMTVGTVQSCLIPAEILKPQAVWGHVLTNLPFRKMGS